MKNTKIPIETDGQNKRRAGRIKASDLSCSIGHPIDLSSTGLQVVCKGLKKPQQGDIVALFLGNANACLQLKAKVMRITIKGMWSYELGLAFVKLTEEDKGILAQLAREAYVPDDRFYFGKLTQRCLPKIIGRKAS